MKISRLTHRLKSRREALLAIYDEEDLHQLRVSIRRMRSLLKAQGGNSAKRLRKSWRKLARRTNAARDWDTFALFAREHLNPEDFHHLQPLLQHRQTQAHRRVLRALESNQWSGNMQLWKKYARKSGLDSTLELTEAANMGPVLQRVEAARQQALKKQDDASWHALRIAIKELRYLLDNLKPEGPALMAQKKRAVKFCKKLQEDLGDWHDSVIHLALLAQLAVDAFSNGDHIVRRTLDSLDSILRVHGNACLERVRETLEVDQAVLQAASWDREAV
jgi:CHAD domain-containing protein